MLTLLPGLLFLIAAIGPQQGGDGAIAAAPELKAPPSVRAACPCPKEPEPGVMTLRGLVVDAELTLGPDGRSANDRQATIFDITPGNPYGVSGRTRIYHSTDTNKCGVLFDYGSKYLLRVRKTENGEFETDKCLMLCAGCID